jgi:hypothetical protein
VEYRFERARVSHFEIQINARSIGRPLQGVLEQGPSLEQYREITVSDLSEHLHRSRGAQQLVPPVIMILLENFPV